jgi:hypothetical protein
MRVGLGGGNVGRIPEADLARFSLLQFGLAQKKDKTGRKLRKERKNRAKKFRGAS